MVLIKERTWCAVKARDETDPAVSDEVSEQALATICLSIDPSIYGLVRDAKTAKEAWDNLRSTYEDDGSTRKIGLLRKLTAIRLVGAEREEEVICQSTQQYVNELFTTSHQLAEVGFKVDDTWLASLLMKGLPKRYEPMILGLESSGIKLTADIVKAKILQDVKVSESQRDKGEEAFYSNSKPQKKVDKSTIKCYRCSKLGHYASECSKQQGEKKLSTKSGRDGKQSGHAAFFAAYNAVEAGAKPEEWIFDSGATTHLCRNRNALNEVVDVSGSINVANNSVVPVVAKGSVKLEADCDGTLFELDVSNVLCVPELAINLMSVSKICSNGYQVVFDKESCHVVSPKNQVVAIGKETGGLYKLSLGGGSVNMVQAQGNFELWHRRLGHLSVGNMKRLTGMATGINYDTPASMKCVSCIEGRHSREPFKSKGRRADCVLELVHTDLCGPMETKSIGGCRYFLTFVDDASRKVFIYFLKSKTEVLESFEDFKSYAENQTGETIKCLRSDNGREYVNSKMKRYLRQAGIRHETSVPYNPQQNGLAERMNRTIVERARSMLCDAKLNKRFWAEAVASASYVINRSPMKELKVTPEEKFTGKKPDLAHLRVFGSEVMVRVPDEKRQKWDPKSEKCIFMGYSQNSKAYRVYHPKKRNVIVSRDVIFLREDQAGALINGEEPPASIHPVELVIESDCAVDQAPITDVPNAAGDNRDDCESNGSGFESEYSDAEEGSEENQPTFALPSHSEDPQLLVRRSERERLLPGKYRDFHMGLGILPKKFSPSSQNMHIGESEPQTFDEALASIDGVHWEEAMRSEYQSLIQNGTWELTDLPKGRKALRCKWVYRVKTNADGSVERFKARLVIKGFSQVKGVDYTETYSPVVRYATVRYLMAAAARLDLKIHQMDAVTAFLQGDLEDEEIYMEQPEGFVDQANPNQACRLRKALYGLKQASRVWNQKLDAQLKQAGLKRSKYDTCVYFKTEGKSVLIVAVYVDDLLIFSNDQQLVDTLKRTLASKFQMKDLGLADKVLGISVTRTNDEVMLDQEQYIEELLRRFGVVDCNTVATPTDYNQKLTKAMSPQTEEERNSMKNVPFRELVGGLQFLAQGTRPDIGYATNTVSQFSCNPGKAHWTAAKRILRYLKYTKDMKLVYSKKADPMFLGYSDADWANDLESRRSITGFAFIQSGGPIAWCCRKQSTVALSTTEAEYMAVSAATQEAMWWKGLRKELFGDSEPVTIYCDNLSAICLAENEVGYSPRSKHIDIRHHFVREKIAEKAIKLEHVGTKLQTADLLTKAVPVATFEAGRKALGIKQIHG